MIGIIAESSKFTIPVLIETSFFHQQLPPYQRETFSTRVPIFNQVSEKLLERNRLLATSAAENIPVYPIARA